MSNPRTLFHHKETNTETAKAAADVVVIDKTITRKEYEQQLEEAKAMAFGI